MAYTKQGPWGQGGIINAAQWTAMDNGIAAAQAVVATDLGTVSGAVTLDALTADSFTVSLSAAATITVTNIHQTGIAVETTLLIKANTFAVTWDASIVFPSGQPGALTGAPSIVRFMGLPGGTTVYGRLIATF